ncbi:GNAT family N-acetyltransferase [Brevibacillus nitrificans]|uniref:GNAT family N-acetyltransferase n=1 Tax=Brevibacillus nitrificans TaxID=651560 RepID=UPI0026123C10|nr:GNAT family N-acetyltransferase [Brevibacillus nitrificans]MED1792742.1 GNAT family N-acetyltransferase [Brevibacillus nitrificans]
MQWYERLNEYFPEHEMKDPGQFRALIEDKDVYHKEETEDYLLLYAEFEDFLFIDYLLIHPNTRGKGIGTKVLNKLKEKGKTILLEVEPVDEQDEDTVRRARFYDKNGFVEADRIKYEREDQNGEPYEMIVYYWSPDGVPQKEILENMAKACREIHNFRSHRFYGREVANPDEVLTWKH